MSVHTVLGKMYLTLAAYEAKLLSSELYRKAYGEQYQTIIMPLSSRAIIAKHQYFKKKHMT